MVQKSQNNDHILHKGKINTFFGEFNLYSIRNNLNPVFFFNLQSLILFFVSILVFPFSSISRSSEEFKLFAILVSYDLIISAVILRPFSYVKSGYDINKSDELKQMFINYEIDSILIKTYFKFLLPRVIFYVILTQMNINYDLKSLTAIYFVLWTIFFTIVGILFVITITMVALGLLLEDYLNEGSSHRAWTGFRQEVSNSALELDKLISKINNSQNTRFNKDSRQKLAKTLFKLRNFLVLENQTDSNYSTDLKVKFVNAEKEFSQKLLDNLRDDKCVVCYTNLNNSKGQLLACPQCGHGGHKDHLEEWFKNKTSCPACKSDLSTSQFLLLS